MTRALLFTTLFLAGCSFDPDLSRYPQCTANGVCARGATCVPHVLRCVPDCEGDCDAGVLDAGSDAGLDAGTVDAGVMDAGAPDAGDAGSTDAGPELQLTASALTPAIETQPWSFRFQPTGGLGNYHFAIDGGVPGFSLAVDGTLSTASAPTPGTFTFSITVEDDATPRAKVSADYALQVQRFLRVASTTLLDGRSGQSYSDQLQATGGLAPYTWSTDGGLPNGLSLASNGALTGTASGTTSGVKTFSVTVEDSSTPPQHATRQVGVQVKLLDTLLVIATPAVADGRVGQTYTQPLKGYGGTQPYSWSLASGTLPPGITITNNGTLGQLGGTPTDAGTYTFTLRCNDTLTSTTQPLSLVVY